MSLVTEWPREYRYFKASEMACRCGCGMLPDPEFMAWLDTLRGSYGLPMRITSGARCEKHNAAVGGAPESMHVQGTAADVAVYGPAAMKLIGVAKLWNVAGLGLKQHGPTSGRMVHLDTGPREIATCWTYP